jgi:peptidoglycan/LPS O-acetylase OafA/YrhL
LDKPPHIEFLWKATFSRLEPIVLGSLLAYFLRGEVPKLSTNRRWLLGAAGFGGLLLVGKFGATFGWRSLFGLPVAAICCTAILIAVLQPMSSTRPGPIQTVLVHLGRISYGLYVFHWAALQYCAQHIGVPRYPHVELLIRWGAAFMLTLVLAECSYWTIEKPFLKLKDRFSFVKADRKTPAENRSAETINAAANA